MVASGSAVAVRYRRDEPLGERIVGVNTVERPPRKIRRYPHSERLLRWFTFASKDRQSGLRRRKQ